MKGGLPGVLAAAFAGGRIGREFLDAVRFLTRLPLPAAADGRFDLAGAVWAFPLVGAGIGAASGLVFASAWALGLPRPGCALLALAAGMLLTGALHEDGLADTADGFGGGGDLARKLAIMRDSRIGTYGVLALILATGLRAAALAGAGGPAAAVTALVVAHGASRAFVPLAMLLLEPARTDGLAASAGSPSERRAAVAAGLGAGLAFLLLGPGRGTLTLLAACVAVGMMLLAARRQIGGYTGDVLGSVQQVGEITMLLASIV